MTSRKDDSVIGLLFGDEGKGTTVDYLAHLNRPESVVRFSGGPQTAHNVVAPDGTHHTFAQFGAASLQHVPTTLSRFTLVNPFNLVTEGDLLYEKTHWNPFPDLIISENALLITPIHVWLNKKREEARGVNAHGSCGEGIGETRLFHIRFPEQAPVMGDLLPENLHRLKGKLETLYQYSEEETGFIWNNGDTEALMEQYINLSQDAFLNIVSDEVITQRISEGYHIFEGSQGVLLDESLGFHPHTTWSSTTSANAQILLAEAGKPAGTVIGVTRTYATRHGFGPFPSEVDNTPENIEKFPESHNTYGRYQGAWRRGYLDLPLLEYAVRANGGIDELSLTHCDTFNPEIPIVYRYDNWIDIPSEFFNRDRKQQEIITNSLLEKTEFDVKKLNVSTLEELEELLVDLLKVPVRYRSFGKTYNDKQVI